MLQLKDLKSVDGKWRFDRHLNLVVRTNQLACVTIPAGSALLNAILAQAPAEGYISIDSERITPSTIQVLGKKLAYLPEALPCADMTVDELAPYFFPNDDAASEQSHKDLMKAWDELLIDKALFTERISHIPQTTLRMICLSLVGVSLRKVLLLNNPTSGLGDDEREKAVEYIRRLPSADRLVVVATTDERLLAKADIILK